jgi:shikimate kinase|tara:strand:- start:1704 stop:2210 length:507 start_codon:yes stop_codon:yes gene_type:complete
MSNIFLVGFMGAGKTTTGSLLAEKMKFDFLDTDQMIVDQESKEIVQIFESSGEEYFRNLETIKLKEAEGYTKTIFSTGGGIILRENNRDILNRNFCVYLKASYDVIFSRIERDSSRPLLNTDDPYSTGLKIFQSRRALYESFSCFVETDNLSAESVADKIRFLYENKK